MFHRVTKKSMSHGLRTAVACAVCVLAAVPAVAQYQPDKKGPSKGVVMKSVDASGKLVYSDHPLPGVRETEVLRGRGFENLPVVAPKVPAQAASAGGSLSDWAQATEAQIAASRKAVDDTNTRVAKQNCDDARQTLATLTAGRRVMRVNERGEPEALTSDQLTVERDYVEQRIAIYCK